MTVEAAPDACCLCGEDAADAEAIPGGVLLRCRGCSLSRTGGDAEAAEVLYGDDYHAGDGYDDYYDPVARRFESKRRLAWLRSVGRPERLLEVGAAAGFFLDAARARGIEVLGVELSASAAAYANERLGVPVQAAAFEVAELRGPFDAVVAFHVLEHVADPMAFARRARSLLAPSGLLALEVPNLDSAASRRLGAAWPHLQPRFHRWHFTPATLGRLVADAGFDVVSADTVFSRYYWRAVPRVLHARELFVADLAASRRVGVAHPALGDFCRLIARPTPS